MSQPDAAELAALGARLPPSIRFGTSTWNYPGWKGLVYHLDYPERSPSARMLEEYARFPLFRTVGIDSSFYGPPTPATLRRYASYLPAGFPCVSKVWDRITVHTFVKERYPTKGGEPNPEFLDAEVFLREVFEPYAQNFADHTGPFVFEFQAIARMEPQEFADRLDRFLSQLPREGQYGVEVRNAEFLSPSYLAVLREHNVAHVFNAWTRMPSIGEQVLVPGAFTAPFVVARALLRPGRAYAEAVEAFAPYDRIREPNPQLRADLVELIRRALALRIPAYVLVNNRAEGNAPLTIAAVAGLLVGGSESGGAKGEGAVPG